MPKRKHKQFVTIPSEPVQGEGAYAKIKNLSLEEIMDLQGDNPANMSDEEKMKAGLAILDRMIVDWNWVGDDDEPLPIPAENPGTVAGLPFQEMTFLMEASGLADLFDTKN